MIIKNHKLNIDMVELTTDGENLPEKQMNAVSDTLNSTF